jgi:endonuclease YncB( thermonuclease family)
LLFKTNIYFWVLLHWMRAYLIAMVWLLAACSEGGVYHTSYGSVHGLCRGEGLCFLGNVNEVIDGDTLLIEGETVRLALVKCPEQAQQGYAEAKALAAEICPPGTPALVDEDDMQAHGSYGRLIGVVYCDGRDLNAAMIASDYCSVWEEFCLDSEFAHVYCTS